MGLIDAVAAAKALGVQPATIRQWASRGKITAQGTDHRGRKLYEWDILKTVFLTSTPKACAA